MRLISLFIAALLPALFCQCASPKVAAAKTLPSGVVRGSDGTLYYDPNEAPQGQERSAAPPDVISYWDGGAGSGPPKIRISLSEQTAYFYKGGTLVGKSWLSTGSEGHRTPTGSFRIIQKNKWHKSSRYGAFVDAAGNVVDGDVDAKKDRVPPGLRYEGAKMTNFMRLTPDGVGMHAGFLPGYPASHGCIRMPENMSENFFNNVALGTPVTIVP
jgi:lipoprotein-anchoring transpeptidase ErfK/SrfK